MSRYCSHVPKVAVTHHPSVTHSLSFSISRIALKHILDRVLDFKILADAYHADDTFAPER
jgi:hypothetical protein